MTNSAKLNFRTVKHASCKVLEVDGSNALVQLFESAAGINLANSNGKIFRSFNGTSRISRYAFTSI